ncbi:transposase [Purpureocillium lavendulum]|uniref:Transposase n=1 Tax=Purpureocillium lavendulum TaxID=1247861 RepID=A0AB34FE54_9HYPO|nr:transposase [Purpureocillium lavendulum]
MPAATQDHQQDDGDDGNRPKRTRDGSPASRSTATVVGDHVAGVYALTRRSLDRVVAPSSRRRAYDAASAFASSRPILFSLLLAQALLSSVPLVLFAFFCASTACLALAAGLAFTFFWVGVALLVLVPTLLLTSSVAALLWAWALGAFLVARWLYGHAPTTVTGVQVHATGKNIAAKDDNGHGVHVKEEQD